MDRSVFVTLGLRNQQFLAGLAQSAAAARTTSRQFGSFAAKHEQDFQRVGTASMAMGAAMAAGVALSVRAAVQWESAWAGVLKTADTKDPLQLAALESDLRQLAKTLPATHQEIAAVAEAAGQLGISTPAVADFTKVMVDLGETTNLTADQAATAIARISNIMQIAPQDVDRFGAALVELGNNGASTEAEIVEMATRIASAGSQIGLSGADVLAFANALSSVGIEAEAGGSSISRVFIDMRDAVMGTTPALDVFAATAGVSAREFARSFNDDAGLAVVSFIEGLGAMEAQGKNSNDVLSELGLTDIRVGNALRAAAGAGDLFRESLEMGTRAWEANTALVEEAEKRYATTEAKMQVAKNTVNDLAIDLGSTLLPALAGAADALSDFAGWMSGLPEPVKSVLAVVGSLAAVVGLVGGAALIAVPKVVALKASLEALGVTAGRTGATMLTVAKAAGVVALALSAASVAGDAFRTWVGAVSPEASKAAKTLLQIGEAGEATKKDMQELGAGGYEFGEMLDGVFNRGAAANVAGFFRQISGLGGLLPWGDDSVDAARTAFKSIDDGLMQLVSSGNAEEAARSFSVLKEQADAQGVSVEQLAEVFPLYADAVGTAATEQDKALASSRAMADAVSGVDASVTNAYSSLGAFAESLGLTEEGTKKLTEQVGSWADSLAEFISPLGAYTALLEQKTDADRASAEARAEATETEKDSWKDYTSAVSVSVGEYLAELERQVQAQEAHADNMTRLAGRVSQGTLDELARMGPEGAPLVAQLVNASDAELARLDDLFGRRTKDATGAMAAELFLANTLLPEIAAKVGTSTATALARELAAGTTTVAQIAQDYAWALEGGLAPLLKTLGVRTVQSLVRQENAQARRPAMNATGNLYEEHQAEIAPGGAWRVWAEPETGGEAYIPLAPSKRQRSVGIWQETGRRLGVFAAGGFYSEQDVPPVPSTKPYGPPISTAGDRTMQVARAGAIDFLLANAMSAGGGPGSVAGDGELASNAVRAKQAALSLLGFSGAIGGWGRRGNATQHDDMIGGRKASRALDFMTSNLAVGNRLVDYFSKQPYADYLIWQQTMFPLQGRPPYRMGNRGSKTANHYDHVHLSVFGKGGILNPHVRDAGGPLLPGFTYNGTGRPEMVLPFAAGGILSPLDRARTIRAEDGSRVPASFYAAAAKPRTVTDAPRSLTDPAAIRAQIEAYRGLVEGYKAYNEQVAQAARRTDLLRAVQGAQYELVIAMRSGTKEHAAAQTALANAERKQAQAKTANAKANAAAAVQQARDRVARTSTEELTQARRKLADVSKTLLEFDQAATRAGHEAAQQRRIELLEKEAEAAERAADARRDALARVNDLLDRERDVRARGAEAEQDYADKVADIQKRRAAAEATLAAGSLRAAQELATRQQDLLDQRRVQLEGWARLDERAAVSWGNSVQQLLANAREQAAQFEEWAASLAEARGRGVSEQVIAALGLDEGPQALGQLRQFGRATQAEIDALNAEVARRTALAGAQTSREQQGRLGDLGRDLTAAQQQYVDTLADLQQRFTEEQAELGEQLVQAQSDLLVRQAEIATELAAIGQDQARSYGEALEQGLRSQIPAVLAAAQALQAAARGATTNASMVNGRYIDTMTGRAAFYGPNGEPAYASAKDAPPGALTHRMPDGRTAYYIPKRTFDVGGWLQPGWTMAYNGTGRPERVVGPQGQGGTTLVVNVNGPVFGVDDLHRQIRAGATALLTEQRGVATVTGSR